MRDGHGVPSPVVLRQWRKTEQKVAFSPKLFFKQKDTTLLITLHILMVT